MHKKCKWLTGTLHLMVSKFRDCPESGALSKLENIEEVVNQILAALKANFRQILEGVERLSWHLKSHSWLEDAVGDVLQKDFDLDGIKDLCDELQYLLHVPESSQQIQQVNKVEELVHEVIKILRSQRADLLQDSDVD